MGNQQTTRNQLGKFARQKLAAAGANLPEESKNP